VADLVEGVHALALLDIVSSSRTARCVVEAHGSANAATKINVASSHWQDAMRGR